MGAINQTDFMTAVVGTDPSGWRVPTGFFPPSSPMASDAGLSALTSPRDLGKVRSDLQEAGYRGEKVVLVVNANAFGPKACSAVAADAMRKVGIDVDEQIMDSATWFRRILSKKPPDEGGWNVLCGILQGTDALSPANHSLLAFPGWPNSEKIKALRDQWLETADVTAQRQIAAEIQAQAFIDVPYYPLGTCYFSTAFRSDLTGVLDGQAIFWNVRRQG